MNSSSTSNEKISSSSSIEYFPLSSNLQFPYNNLEINPNEHLYLDTYNSGYFYVYSFDINRINAALGGLRYSS